MRRAIAPASLIGAVMSPKAASERIPTVPAPTRRRPVPTISIGLVGVTNRSRVSALCGSGGSSSARYTHPTGASAAPVSTGTSNFGRDLCRRCGAASGRGKVISCHSIALFNATFDEIDQARVIVRGSAARRILPDGLVTGSGVVQIDALPDSRLKHMPADGRVAFKRLHRRARVAWFPR